MGKGDAPQVGGGGKAGNVPYNAAAQGDEEVRAGDGVFNEEIVDGKQHRVGLGVLAVREGEGAVFHPGGIQGALHLLQVQRGDGVVGDDGRPAPRQDLADLLAAAVQQAVFNLDLVGEAGVYGDGFHMASLLRFGR